VFIVVTQLLFFYCIYVPLLPADAVIPHEKLFYLLIAASVLIAAAGYIINDYFDLRIDAINKPDRLIVDKYIKRRWAILWHWLLSGLGILLSLYISYRSRVWVIAIANFFCVLLLWFYSTTLKSKLLSGNIIIAALAAWVILVVYFFAGANIFSVNVKAEGLDLRKFFKFTLLYAGFAFIMTVVREVIKDLQDMEGDRKYNCNTMPIAWGVPASKVFTAVWIVVSIAALAAIIAYAWLSGWWWSMVYVSVTVILPLIVILQKLKIAVSPADYHRLSNYVKAVMLAGILSMLLIKFTP
jgi:4-hydroxybenzoate polyprenyltransferase